MHGISLAGPDAMHCVVIAEPAVEPHKARFRRELIGDLLPESDISKIWVGKRCIGVRRRKQLGPRSQNRCTLSDAGLKINRTEMLDDGAARLLRAKAVGDVLPAFP